MHRRLKEHDAQQSSILTSNEDFRCSARIAAKRNKTYLDLKVCGRNAERENVEKAKEKNVEREKYRKEKRRKGKCRRGETSKLLYMWKLINYSI